MTQWTANWNISSIRVVDAMVGYWSNVPPVGLRDALQNYRNQVSEDLGGPNAASK